MSLTLYNSRAILVAGLLASLSNVPARGQSLPTIELRRGLVISKSSRVAPRTYSLPGRSSDSAVITIRGDNITLDFGGATMAGTALDANPNVAAGIAIRIDGGSNIRIVNANIRGYKVGIIARGTRGLSLIDNDLSYNWKPRLYSIIEHESLIDWLSFHKNEKDEWLRYGAGAYLSDVTSGEIRGNTVTQGMNGLMLVRTNGLRIWDNNFSFNSGVGIGLYRSSGNSIMHNRVDYNVRGYSEGFYRRGQDAAVAAQAVHGGLELVQSERSDDDLPRLDARLEQRPPTLRVQRAAGENVPLLLRSEPDRGGRLRQWIPLHRQPVLPSAGDADVDLRHQRRFGSQDHGPRR